MGGLSAPYSILYHPDTVKKDIPRLSSALRDRVQQAIEIKLSHSPESFGEPLRRTLKGYWKLRVGDYRVIYKISGKEITILKIGHRSEVYQS